jgi:hypothetical protein
MAGPARVSLGDDAAAGAALRGLTGRAGQIDAASGDFLPAIQLEVPMQIATFAFGTDAFLIPRCILRRTSQRGIRITWDGWAQLNAIGHRGRNAAEQGRQTLRKGTRRERAHRGGLAVSPPGGAGWRC